MSEPAVALVIPQVTALLDVLKGELSVVELLAALGMRNSSPSRERYLQLALAAGLIEMTVAIKPNPPFCLNIMAPVTLG